MSNNSTESKKAERGTVVIGDITLNGYLMPNGTYCLAGRNVTDAINEPANSLLRASDVKSLKDLPHADPTLLQVTANTGEKFIPVAIEDAVVYWMKMAQKGNEKAAVLVVSLALETLERRLDRVFTVKRTEEERDARLALRMKRIKTFRDWTDCIKESQEYRKIYQTEEGKAEFKKLITAVNIALFKQPHFNCNRDNMTPEQQNIISMFEMLLSSRFSVDKDITSIISECLEFMGKKALKGKK